MASPSSCTKPGIAFPLGDQTCLLAKHCPVRFSVTCIFKNINKNQQSSLRCVTPNCFPKRFYCQVFWLPPQKGSIVTSDCLPKDSIVKSSAPASILFHVYQFLFSPEVLNHDCFFVGGFCFVFIIPSPILDFSIWFERLLHQGTFPLDSNSSERVAPRGLSSKFLERPSLSSSWGKETMANTNAK